MAEECPNVNPVYQNISMCTCGMGERTWGGLGRELHVTVAPGTSFSHRKLKTQRSRIYRKYQTSKKMKAEIFSFLAWISVRGSPAMWCLPTQAATLLGIVYSKAGLERGISWYSCPLHHSCLNPVSLEDSWPTEAQRGKVKINIWDPWRSQGWGLGVFAAQTGGICSSEGASLIITALCQHWENRWQVIPAMSTADRNSDHVLSLQCQEDMGAPKNLCQLEKRSRRKRSFKVSWLYPEETTLNWWWPFFSKTAFHYSGNGGLEYT